MAEGGRRKSWVADRVILFSVLGCVLASVGDFLTVGTVTPDVFKLDVFELVFVGVYLWVFHRDLLKNW